MILLQSHNTDGLGMVVVYMEMNTEYSFAILLQCLIVNKIL